MMSTPLYQIGQLVRHRRFGYRGVVVDADFTFGLSDQWYEQVARSRPPKDKPWYKVLVSGSSDETYVAERHLETDDQSQEIEHPRVAEFFDSFHGSHYRRDRDLN